MEKIGKSLTSTIRTDRGNSFQRANDRFKAPTLKKQSPAPTAYRITDSIGYDDSVRQTSPYKTSRMQRAVFGREDRERQFTKLLKPIELTDRPGPGQYSHYTQFNNDTKLASSVRSGGKNNANEAAKE